MRTLVSTRVRRALLLVFAGSLALVAAGAVGALAVARFSDVPASHPHAAGIGYVADTGITVGCGGGRYCPGDPVTRAQMATFMHRLSGNASTPPSVNAAALGGVDAAVLLAEVADLRAELDAAHARIADLDTLLAGVTRESVAGRDTLRFTAMNLQVVNGIGGTSYSGGDGLGNLIIGYDEGREEGDDKSGSHYLVVGEQNNYTARGGIVAGWHNDVTDLYASVTGGSFNVASGFLAAVSGGQNNTASGDHSSISGGYGSHASGDYSSVTGGAYHDASGHASSVAGGYVNRASGGWSTILGGYRNTVSEEYGMYPEGWWMGPIED
jgi:hypothetical protein